MALLGLTGALSQSLLAADALVAHSQAKALRPKTTESTTGSEVASAPRIAPFASPTQDGGAVVGLAGSF
jgi:hypothetical protein